MPSDHQKYNLLIGDNEDISEEERELRKLEKRDEYISGGYHQRSAKRVAEGTAPKFSFDILAKAKGIYYQDIQECNRNDCLIYAINYACRAPLFSTKEQVVRFISHQLKIPLEAAQVMKVNGGLEPRCFTKRFAGYMTSRCIVYYKLVKLDRIDISNRRDTGPKGVRGVEERIINKFMLREHLPPLYREIIMCGIGMKNNPFGHAYALVYHQSRAKKTLRVVEKERERDTPHGKSVAVMCSSSGNCDWYPYPPTKELCFNNQKLDLHAYFDEFQDMTFYGLEKERYHFKKCDPQRRKALINKFNNFKNKMVEVMSGEKVDVKNKMI